MAKGCAGMKGSMIDKYAKGGMTHSTEGLAKKKGMNTERFKAGGAVPKFAKGGKVKNCK